MITDFQAASATFPFGAHVAVVEVDTETGRVELVRHIAVDDAGRILNPLLADGQRHGGIAQGAAQALLEEVRYDEDGNPVTSNLADYAAISATELPSFELVAMETPTDVNPLGVKGIGESGTIGSTPAVQSAVVDALAAPRRAPPRHAGEPRASVAGDIDGGAGSHRMTRPIEAEGLVRRFGDVVAVDGVDLVVDEGEIFGFLGPNGAGKSTIVRMLTTLLKPTAGRARVAGHDVVEEAGAVRRAIGVALQDAAIDPLMTGRELVRLQAVLHGIAKSDADRRGDVLLERVGLVGAANRRVGTYSGGMRRRLDLALSLVHEPSVLFLDEPTTGLDPTSRTALWEEVRRLNAEGTTVFLTTQYLEEADELAGSRRHHRQRPHRAGGAAGDAQGQHRCRHPRRHRRRRPRGAGRRGARPVREQPRRQDRLGRHRHRRRRRRAVRRAARARGRRHRGGARRARRAEPRRRVRRRHRPPARGRRGRRRSARGGRVTTTAVAPAHGEVRIGARQALAQARGLARRSIRGTVRVSPRCGCPDCCSRCSSPR